MSKRQVKKVRGAISMGLALSHVIIPMLVMMTIIGIILWIGISLAQELRVNIELHASTSGFVVNIEVLQGQLGGAPQIRYAPSGSTNYQTVNCNLLAGDANAKAGQSASFICPAPLIGGEIYDVIVVVREQGGKIHRRQIPGVMVPVT